MLTITADELETGGVAAIEAALASDSEAVITVEGKNKFVVMPIEQFQYLRECELEAALARTKKALSEGHFVTSSPEEHVARVQSGGDGLGETDNRLVCSPSAPLTPPQGAREV